MRIKARLSNAAIEKDPPNDPATNPDFLALGALFDIDPIIAFDDRGWYLSASSLDSADELRQAFVVREELDRLVDLMNGIALLLRVETNGAAVRPTYEFDGRLFTGTAGRLYSASVSVSTTDGLDPQSARRLLTLATTDAWVRRIVLLFQHIDRDWVWFDLWRIWDVMKGHFPKGAFRRWVESLDPSFADSYVSFENCANDPRLGDNRRHALPDYESHSNASGAVPPSMDSQQATDFVKSVVFRWLDYQHSVTLRRQ